MSFECMVSNTLSHHNYVIKNIIAQTYIAFYLMHPDTHSYPLWVLMCQITLQYFQQS